MSLDKDICLQCAKVCHTNAVELLKVCFFHNQLYENLSVSSKFNSFITVNVPTLRIKTF